MYGIRIGMLRNWIWIIGKGIGIGILRIWIGMIGIWITMIGIGIEIIWV